MNTSLRELRNWSRPTVHRTTSSSWAPRGGLLGRSAQRCLAPSPPASPYSEGLQRRASGAEAAAETLVASPPRPSRQRDCETYARYGGLWRIKGNTQLITVLTPTGGGGKRRGSSDEGGGGDKACDEEDLLLEGGCEEAHRGSDVRCA